MLRVYNKWLLAGCRCKSGLIFVSFLCYYFVFASRVTQSCTYRVLYMFVSVCSGVCLAPQSSPPAPCWRVRHTCHVFLIASPVRRLMSRPPSRVTQRKYYIMIDQKYSLIILDISFSSVSHYLSLVFPAKSIIQVAAFLHAHNFNFLCALHFVIHSQTPVCTPEFRSLSLYWRFVTNIFVGARLSEISHYLSHVFVLFTPGHLFTHLSFR